MIYKTFKLYVYSTILNIHRCQRNKGKIVMVLNYECLFYNRRATEIVYHSMGLVALDR